jgi:prepilin-type N-terminal cleavage/methylation domain-containing protein
MHAIRPQIESAPLLRRPRPARRRRAFTLIELVLVLAIVVMMIGLTWPLMEKPLAYERLRNAADQVMAEWTFARIEAMRSGDHQIFSYEPGTGNYQLSFQAQSEPLELPEGVIFVSSLKEDDARESLEDGGMGGLGDPEVWFYADGTCSDVPELLLENEHGMRIRIALRGLTGVTFVDENVPDADTAMQPGGARR